MVINGFMHGFTESGFVRISVDIPKGKGKISEDLDDFVKKFTPILKNLL